MVALNQHRCLIKYKCAWKEILLIFIRVKYNGSKLEDTVRKKEEIRESKKRSQININKNRVRTRIISMLSKMEKFKQNKMENSSKNKKK